MYRRIIHHDVTYNVCISPSSNRAELVWFGTLSCERPSEFSSSYTVFVDKKWVSFCIIKIFCSSFFCLPGEHPCFIGSSTFPHQLEIERLSIQSWKWPAIGGAWLVKSSGLLTTEPSEQAITRNFWVLWSSLCARLTLTELGLQIRDGSEHRLRLGNLWEVPSHVLTVEMVVGQY